MTGIPNSNKENPMGYKIVNFVDYVDSLGRVDIETRINKRRHDAQSFIHEHKDEIAQEILAGNYSYHDDWGGGWSWRVQTLDKKIGGRTIELQSFKRANVAKDYGDGKFVTVEQLCANVHLYEWGANGRRDPHCSIIFEENLVEKPG